MKKMVKQKNKLELTCIGNDKRPKLEVVLGVNKYTGVS